MSTGSNVLIAEDDMAARARPAELIARVGFRVTTAADGREALEKIESEPPRAAARAQLADELLVNEAATKLSL